MRIGVQYYRIPNPERRYWREDFERMSGLGISRVRFWIYWSSVNPGRDRWSWDELDELWSLAEEFGLGVVGQLIPESHPHWFIRQHADLVPKNPDGTRAQLLGHTIAAASAYPGITFDHRAAQDGMAGFIAAVSGRYRSHPATQSWDVWNEIQPFSVSYDDVTAHAWQQWLTARFDSFDSFREYAQVDVGGFEDIPLISSDLPDRGSGTLNLRYLFREWMSDRMIDEMSRRADVVRSVDPDHPVVSHRRGATFIDPVVDEAKLAQVLDLWGTSNYGSAVTTTRATHELGLKLALARGISGPKPFWLAETTAGRMYHLYGHTLPTGGDIRTSLLMALAHGAESALLWQFRHERFGQEAAGFGLLDFDGGANDRVDAVAQLGHALALRRDGGVAVRESSPITLVIDPRTLWVERSMDQPIEQEVTATDELLGWYVAAQDGGLSPDVTTPTALTLQGIPDGVSVLVAPMQLQEHAEYGALIESWVKAGGTYVETAFAGMLDAELRAPALVPSGRLGEIQHGRVVARDYPGPVDGLLVDGFRIPGSFTEEAIVPVSGDRDAAAAVSVTALGAGRIIHLGSLPGLATLQGEQGLAAWLSSLVAPTDDLVSVTTEPGVIVERVHTDSARSIMAFNSTPDPVVVSVVATSGRGTLEDVLSGDIREWSAAEQHDFTVPPRDCIWIEMKGVNP